MAEKRTALLIGASGMIGKQLVYQLLDDADYSSVSILVRKDMVMKNPKLHQHIVNFDQLEESSDLFKVDDVFCTLGTTMNNAGTQEAFLKVDKEYVLKTAQIAKQQGAKQFSVVSSMGADSHSSIFYSRVKGEVENSLKELKFTSLHIFRPSILDGDRREFRPGEKISLVIMKLFSILMIGPLANYAPIKAITVAKAMVKMAKKNQEGAHVHLSGEIRGMV